MVLPFTMKPHPIMNQPILYAILILTIILPTRIGGDSYYCSPYASINTNYTALGYDEYHSCCGISAAGSLILSQTNNSLWAAANASPVYIACRTGTLRRCCPWRPNNITVPVITDTTGRSLQYSFQPVPSDSVYQCVGVPSEGGCCDASDCSGDLGSNREWSCSSSGVCASVSSCPYSPLAFNRVMLLFVAPGLLLLLELIHHLFIGKLISVDVSGGSFGRERVLVQYLWFLLNEYAFQSIVILQFAVAIGTHLWNAIQPLDSCAHDNYGETLEYVWAIMYLIGFIIPVAVRRGTIDEPHSYYTSYEDALLYMKFIHIFPFVWTMYYGPGQSAIDQIILIQQAIGFRWMIPALLMLPFMAFSPPTRNNPAYSVTYRFLDLMFWKSHVIYYDYDTQSRLVGYTRRVMGYFSNKAFNELARYPAELEFSQEFIAHRYWCCCRHFLVGPTQPDYPYDPYAGGRVHFEKPHEMIGTPHGSANARNDPRMSPMDSAYPPPSGARAAQLEFIRQMSTPLDTDAPLTNEIEMSRPGSTLRGPSLTAHPSLVSSSPNHGVPPLTLPTVNSRDSSVQSTPRYPPQPNTASILRQYPDPPASEAEDEGGRLAAFRKLKIDPPGASPPISVKSSPRGASEARKMTPAAAPAALPPSNPPSARKTAAIPTPKFDLSTNLLNPWSSSLNTPRRETKEDEEARKEQKDNQPNDSDQASSLPIPSPSPTPSNPTNATEMTVLTAGGDVSSQTTPRSTRKAKAVAASSESDEMTLPNQVLSSTFTSSSSAIPPRPSTLPPLAPISSGFARSRVVDGTYLPPITNQPLTFQPRPLIPLSFEEIQQRSARQQAQQPEQASL